MKKITVNKDQVIFRQGDTASCMYDILSGKIGIYKDYQTETEEKVAELEAGELFGEMGLIEIYPRSATAVALTDAELEELEEKDLTEYLKDKPEKLLRVMRQLSQRLRETTKKYVDVCRTVSDERQNRKDLNKYASLYTTYWVG